MYCEIRWNRAAYSQAGGEREEYPKKDTKRSARKMKTILRLRREDILKSVKESLGSKVQGLTLRGSRRGRKAVFRDIESPNRNLVETM